MAVQNAVAHHKRSVCATEAVDVRSLSVWTLMTGHLSDMEIQAPTLDLAKRVLFALWRDGPEQLPPAEKGELGAAAMAMCGVPEAICRTSLRIQYMNFAPLFLQPRC